MFAGIRSATGPARSSQNRDPRAGVGPLDQPRTGFLAAAHRRRPRKRQASLTRPRALADLPARVRRATMLAGALCRSRAWRSPEGDADFRASSPSAWAIQPGCSPIFAADIGDAMTTLGEAALEYKLDGARIQVHKVDDEVRVKLLQESADVTIAVPEVGFGLARFPRAT